MKRFTDACVRYVERLMPDPFLLAVLLTFVAVLCVFAFVPDTSAGGLLDAWHSGVWGKSNIFAFALEMIIILVAGYTLAEAPLVQRGLDRLAALPKNQLQAAMVCFFAAAIASLLNWGLGLVVGALVARRVALRLPQVHFGYLVAAGYAGFLVWASGLSSSIALANTDPSSSLNVIHTLTKRTLTLGQALGQPANWVPVLVVLVLVPLLLRSMLPTTVLAPDEALFEQDRAGRGPAEPDRHGSGGGRRAGNRDLRPPTGDGPAAGSAGTDTRAATTAATTGATTTTLDVDTRTATEAGRPTFAQRLEGLRIINLALVAAGFAYFVRSGYSLDIANMVMLFTILGLLLHGTPARFIAAFTDAAKTAGPLVCSTRCTAASSRCSATPRPRVPTRSRSCSPTASPGRHQHDAAVLPLPGVDRHHPVRAVRRRALGGAGPRRRAVRDRPPPDVVGLPGQALHGRRRRRAGREHDPAVLAAAGARHRQAQRARRHGLHGGAVPRRDGRVRPVVPAHPGRLTVAAHPDGGPDYAGLLAHTDAPAGSSWGLFGKGAAGEQGTLALLVRTAPSPGRVPSRGAAFRLDYPLDAFDPPLVPTRLAPRHRITSRHRDARDDVLDGWNPQSSSQIDGLRHRRHPVHGFYNGVADADVEVGSPALGVNRWAERGLAGRGILLDVARHRQQEGRPSTTRPARC